MRDGCSGLGQGGDRLLHAHPQLAGASTGLHRQDHPAVAHHGVGQQFVVARVGRRLVERQVIGDDASAGFAQPVNQRSVLAPRPGPAAQGIEAGVVDGDDDRIGVSAAGRGAHRGRQLVFGAEEAEQVAGDEIVGQQVQALQRGGGVPGQDGDEDTDDPPGVA